MENNASDPSNDSSYKGIHEFLWLDEFIDMADRGFIRRAVLPLALGIAADAVEVLSAGYILNSYRREDGSGLSTIEKELLTAAVFVGMLVGGLLVGRTADRMGRRYALMVSLAAIFAFGALSAVAPSVEWLIAARSFAGVGVGGATPTAFCLGAELFPTKVRGAMVSLIASFWMVGCIFAATAAWIMLGDGFNGERITPGGTWRHYSFVAALPAATALLLTPIFVPESPRFLAKRGRYKETAAVLRRMTNAPIVLPQEALIAPRTVRRPCSSFAARWQSWRYTLGKGFYHGVPREIRSSGDGDDAVNSRVSEDLAQHEAHEGGGMVHGRCPGNNERLRRSTFVLATVWFTLSYGSYGVSAWNTQLFADLGLSNPYICSFIFALASLPGNLISILVIERIGRKRLLFVSMTLAAGAAALFALGAKSGAAVIVSAACLFNAFSTCGWNALSVLSVEAFSTVSRVSTMGLVSAAGRSGSIAAQFANGALEDSVLLLLLVTSGLMLLGGVSSLLLPRDTRGVSLEEPRPGGLAL